MIFFRCLLCLAFVFGLTGCDQIPTIIENSTPNNELAERGVVNREIEYLLRAGINRSEGTFRSIMRNLQGTDWEWIITSIDSFLSQQQRARFQKRIEESLQLASPNVINLDNYRFPLRFIYSIMLIDVLINYANNKGEPFIVLREILDVLKPRQQYMSKELQDFIWKIDSLSTGKLLYSMANKND